MDKRKKLQRMSKVDTWDFPIFLLFLCKDKDAWRQSSRRERGRGWGWGNVCSSFLRRVHLLPAPTAWRRVCVCLVVCMCVVQFEGHLVWGCRTALSHPLTSVCFYLTPHLSTYLTPGHRLLTVNKLKNAYLYLFAVKTCKSFRLTEEQQKGTHVHFWIYFYLLTLVLWSFLLSTFVSSNLQTFVLCHHADNHQMDEWSLIWFHLHFWN